jgi:hypothetical protein
MPVIPRPPNVNGAPEPALQAKSSSRPRLTPGAAGVPAFTGDEYQPLNRKDCSSYYSLRRTNPIPKVGEPISDKELIRVLRKIPDEGDDPYINDSDREMSQFVMDRIDQCYTIPDASVYEVMVKGIKRYRTIHGDLVLVKDAFASASLYRLLHTREVARVGDY